MEPVSVGAATSRPQLSGIEPSVEWYRRKVRTPWLPPGCESTVEKFGVTGKKSDKQYKMLDNGKCERPNPTVLHCLSVQ